MMTSIWDDIKQTFRSGNMISKLIMINIAVYMILALLNAFFPFFYENISRWIYIPSAPWSLITRPWTILTHMFAHVGIWHVGMNMLILYWFGRIIGDLLGDRRVLPLYLLGGFTGAVFYFMAANLLSNVAGGTAHGASAAVLCIVAAAAMTAPDYEIRLLFLGVVKIKWIALAIIFFNIIGTASPVNTGGAWGHLGGLAFGLLYVYRLRHGDDITEWLQQLIIRFSSRNANRTLKVRHTAKPSTVSRPKSKSQDLQKQVDVILDKIKVKGYASLTDEEKEILFTASKK